MNDVDRILLRVRSFDAIHVNVLGREMCQWMPATRYWALLDTLAAKGIVDVEYNARGCRGWVMPTVDA